MRRDFPLVDPAEGALRAFLDALRFPLVAAHERVSIRLRPDSERLIDINAVLFWAAVVLALVPVLSCWHPSGGVCLTDWYVPEEPRPPQYTDEQIDEMVHAMVHTRLVIPEAREGVQAGVRDEGEFTALQWKHDIPDELVEAVIRDWLTRTNGNLDFPEWMAHACLVYKKWGTRHEDHSSGKTRVYYTLWDQE